MHQHQGWIKALQVPDLPSVHHSSSITPITEEQLLEEAAAAPVLAGAETPRPGTSQGWITNGLDDPRFFPT